MPVSQAARRCSRPAHTTPTALLTFLHPALAPGCHLQKLALQIKAQLENVKGLRPSTDDYVLMVKTKCTSCHEEHSKLVGIKPGSEVEMQGGRGTADLVMKCSVSPSRGRAREFSPAY